MHLLFSCRRTCHPERTDTSEKIGVAAVDGSGVTILDFGKFRVPGATKWHKDVVLSGGRRWVMISHHFLRPIGPDVPFHKAAAAKAWIYDWAADRLMPLDVYGRYESTVIQNVTTLPGTDRIVAGISVGDDVIWIAMDADGSNREELTHAGDGFSHVPRFSPDGSRMASEYYTGNPGTRIGVADSLGRNRVMFPGRPGDYHFQPTWSPDGEWIAYVNYRHAEDPGHDRADICLARPDGSGQRFLTQDRPFWLSAVYGGPATYGSGSNPVHWTPDGRWLTFIRLKPGAQTAWPVAEHPAVDDHFGRDYHPEMARGGTDLCLLSPFTGEVRTLTDNPDGTWDFRTVPSPDGRQMAFCRSRVGEPGELWVMALDGTGARFLSRGFADKGADHPAWLV